LQRDDGGRRRCASTPNVAAVLSGVVNAISNRDFGDTMHNCSELLGSLVKRYADLPILVIAKEFPSEFTDHLGRILYLGAEFPERPPRSRDFRFVLCEGTETIERFAAAAAPDQGGRPYALVFIDHDHRLDSVARQINAARNIARDDAVFIFDDAVPPTIGMAGPEPTEAWWVGEVWMLSQLLRPARDGFFCLTTDLPPTGMTAAAGFAPIDLPAAAPTYRMLSAVATDAELRRLIPLADANAVFSRADAGLAAAMMPGVARLDIGGEADSQLFTRRRVSEAFRWDKPPARFVADLSARGNDLSRVRHGPRHGAAKFIDSFADAHLIGFTGIVKESRYFDHWLKESNNYLVDRARDYGSYGNQWTGIVLLNETPVLPRERLDNALPIDAPVLFGTPDEPDNWGMWLLLGLPSLHEFLANRGRYEKFFCYAQHPWQRRLLEDLGLRPDELIPQDREQSYLCRDISLIRKSYRDMFVLPEERAFFRAVVERLAGAAPSRAGRRIFVSRITRTRAHGQYRGLINEAALIAGLQTLGFDIVEPEYLSLAEQAATFHAADIVVGLGGAGMFNTVFCKPGTLVITIESTTSFVDAHTNIFASLGHDYAIILGEEDLDDPRPVQRRWTLDVPRALDLIAQALPDAGGAGG
jgi:hypothetical protein